jgi:hypothetical protein
MRVYSIFKEQARGERFEKSARCPGFLDMLAAILYN